MLITKLGSNPLFVRLTANARRPSLRLVLRVASRLTVLATFAFLLPIFALARLTIDERISYESAQIVYMLVVPSFVILLVGWVSFPLAMLVVTIVAAVFTARDVRGEEYELLRLTDLTARERTLAYVAAAFYRMRVLLGLMLVLLTALPGTFLFAPVSALVIEFFVCPGVCYIVEVADINLTPFVVGMVGGLLVAMVAVSGLLVLAVAIGMRAGLRRRRIGPALWTALLSMLWLLGLLLGLGVGALITAATQELLETPAVLVAIVVGIIALTWGLALGTLDAARHWA